MVPPAGCIQTITGCLSDILSLESVVVLLGSHKHQDVLPRFSLCDIYKLCNMQISNLYIGVIKGRERKKKVNSTLMNISPAGVTW